MCGRFSMFSHVKTIEERFKVEEILTSPQPKYNIAPMQKIPVVVQQEKMQLTEMRWDAIEGQPRSGPLNALPHLEQNFASKSCFGVPQ